MEEILKNEIKTRKPENIIVQPELLQILFNRKIYAYLRKMYSASAHNIVYANGINAIAHSILDINPIFDDIDR